MFKKCTAAIGLMTIAFSAPSNGQSPSQPLPKADLETMTAGLTGRDLERVTAAVNTYNSDQCQGLFESLRMPTNLVRASRRSLDKCSAAVRVLKVAQAARAHSEQPD